jgi:hypothetical protein
MDTMHHCKSIFYTGVAGFHIGTPEPVVFDFASADNWAHCRLHLETRWLKRVLGQAIRSYLRERGSRARWHPECGAWDYARGDFWYQRMLEAFDAAEPDWNERNVHLWPEQHEWNEECPPDCDCEQPPQAYLDAQDEARAKYAPQPGTYQWFQAFGLCHWMADWSAALGTLVYPQLEWCKYSGEKHSTAFGLDNGRLAMIFDILWFEDHGWREIIDGVEQGDHTPVLYHVSRRRRVQRAF